MRDVSPGYLQHFIAYTDTLSSLERLQQELGPAAPLGSEQYCQTPTCSPSSLSVERPTDQWVSAMCLPSGKASPSFAMEFRSNNFSI